MSHLTPIQLFFLTFLYVFSGYTLTETDSVFPLLLPILAVTLWALIGWRGAAAKRGDLAELLGAYMPKRETIIPLGFFLAVTAAETAVHLFSAVVILADGADFLPFSLVFCVFVGASVLLAYKGVTVLGRVAELSLFLLVPLVVFHLFGEFAPMRITGAASGVRLLFSAMPTPIFFLLARTAVAGDPEVSAGFRASEHRPRDRSRCLVSAVILGALFAGALRAFLLLFPFAEAELLRAFLEMTAHLTKLSLLFAILAEGLATKGNRGVFCSVFILGAGVFTFAILGGAVFSPFLWMMLLVFASMAVSGMLGVFALF